MDTTKRSGDATYTCIVTWKWDILKFNAI